MGLFFFIWLNSLHSSQFWCLNTSCSIDSYLSWRLGVTLELIQIAIIPSFEIWNFLEHCNYLCLYPVLTLTRAIFRIFKLLFYRDTITLWVRVGRARRTADARSSSAVCHPTSRRRSWRITLRRMARWVVNVATE